mgnify:FL=1
MLEEIYKVLPISMLEKIKKIGSTTNITEIRLRVGRNILLVTSDVEVEVDYIVNLKDMLDILVKVSKNSIYAIQNEINNGFVVINGGHRIGICGEVVIENAKIKNIKNINSMNIRVARQLIGVADKVMPYIVNNGNVQNTIIISPPGCGKTTILRDIVRQISSGAKILNFKGKNVGLVDERGEIAAVSLGIPNLDVGLRTDIMSNVPKSIGMQMLVRSMGIDVIATDEIGGKEDFEAIKYANSSGVNLVFTMHGNDISDVYKKEEIKKLLNDGIFSVAIILSRKKGVGTIEKICDLKGENILKKAI